MIYKTKYDYAKYPRDNVHTTIRTDIHKELKILCIEIEQPKTKVLDMIIELTLHDKKLKNELINKILTYY